MPDCQQINLANMPALWQAYSMKPQPVLPAAEDVLKITVRLPRELVIAMRHRAIDESCSDQELVARALRSYLEKPGKGGPRHGKAKV
jgi:hypothetical protein